MASRHALPWERLVTGQTCRYFRGMRPSVGVVSQLKRYPATSGCRLQLLVTLRLIPDSQRHGRLMRSQRIE